MTYYVNSSEEFQTAWAHAEPGDVIQLVVTANNRYSFEFKKWEPAGDQKEWSGCCC